MLISEYRRRIYRLFKTGNCYFEGTDFSAVRSEVIAIKADLHKSRSKFHPLNPKSPIPSRVLLKEMIDKNNVIEQQKKMRKEITTSIPLAVRERQYARQNSPTASMGSNSPFSLSPSAAEKTPAALGIHACALPASKHRPKLMPRKSTPVLGAAPPLQQGALQSGNIPLGASKRASHTHEQILQVSQGDLTKVTLGKGLALGSIKNAVLNVRGVRANTKLSADSKLSLQQLHQIKEQQDGAKANELDDGKNYLKLPKRSRRSKNAPQNTDFPAVQRLYMSSASFRPWSKEETVKKVTRSNLCLKALLKDANAAQYMNIKTENLPSHVRKILPLIKSMSPSHVSLNC